MQQTEAVLGPHSFSVLFSFPQSSEAAVLVGPGGSLAVAEQPQQLFFCPACVSAVHAYHPPRYSEEVPL